MSLCCCDGGQPYLEAEVIQNYVATTPFNAEEVQRLVLKFFEIDADRTGLLSFQELLVMSELRANPFALRICQLFSSDARKLTFHDFIEMMSVFSFRTPLEVKVIWAFAMWDFDGDNLIGPTDVAQGVELIVNHASRSSSAENSNELGTFSQAEVGQVVNGVLGEIDPDGWGISFNDFRSVVIRMPEFLINFRMSF